MEKSSPEVKTTEKEEKRKRKEGKGKEKEEKKEGRKHPENTFIRKNSEILAFGLRRWTEHHRNR